MNFEHLFLIQLWCKIMMLIFFVTFGTGVVFLYMLYSFEEGDYKDSDDYQRSSSGRDEL